MVNRALLSLTLFILCMGKLFFCCPSVLPGEKSASSFLIRRPITFVPCLRRGQVLPCQILFWLSLLVKPCYVLLTYSNSRSYSGRSRLTVRRDTDMVQHVAAHHLSRLACLYVRQSTLQQVFEHTESTSRQYALRERASAVNAIPSPNSSWRSQRRAFGSINVRHRPRRLCVTLHCHISSAGFKRMSGWSAGHRNSAGRPIACGQNCASWVFSLENPLCVSSCRNCERRRSPPTCRSTLHLESEQSLTLARQLSSWVDS